MSAQKPMWMEHQESRERAQSIGLVGEPECGACASYIYTGMVFTAHMSGRPQDPDPKHGMEPA